MIQNEEKITKIIYILPEIFKQISDYMKEKDLEIIDNDIPIKNYNINIEDVVDAVIEVANVTYLYKYGMYEDSNDDYEYIVFAHAGAIFEVGERVDEKGVIKEYNIEKLIDSLPDKIYSLKYLLEIYNTSKE